MLITFLESLSPELIAVIVASTELLKKALPPKLDKYKEILAVVLGSVANILIHLPAEWTVSLETALGGGAAGLIATGLYKAADKLLSKK